MEDAGEEEKLQRWQARAASGSHTRGAAHLAGVGAALGCPRTFGTWQMALELLDEMRAKGVPPDAISYNSAISACAKGGAGRARAVGLLDEMQVAGEGRAA